MNADLTTIIDEYAERQLRYQRLASVDEVDHFLLRMRDARLSPRAVDAVLDRRLQLQETA